MPAPCPLALPILLLPGSKGKVAFPGCVRVCKATGGPKSSGPWGVSEGVHVRVECEVGFLSVPFASSSRLAKAGLRASEPLPPPVVTAPTLPDTCLCLHRRL